MKQLSINKVLVINPVCLHKIFISNMENERKNTDLSKLKLNN